MNKKCGNCGWLTDKCKNPNNHNYNKFRNKEDRCTIKTNKKIEFNNIFIALKYCYKNPNRRILCLKDDLWIEGSETCGGTYLSAGAIGKGRIKLEEVIENYAYEIWKEG